MSLVRWDPFREMISLRDAMSRLLDESFLRPWWSTEERGEVFIPLDVYETDDEFEVKAALPGLKPEDVEINVVGNTLTIKGEFREDEEKKEGNFLYRERRYGSFQRSITLPEEVNIDKAEATFENGVLRLRLPKAEHAKPRQIPVKAK